MTLIPVPRVISAAGFVTSLGGGSLSATVRAAMDEAAGSTWRPDDLQAWAGEAIVELTGAEAGWVTAGAAAGMTLAAAACIARTHLSAMDALPDTAGMPAEIIVQRGHRNAYDRAFRTAGARIVEVGYPWIEGVGLTYEWQLEAAFSQHTVAVGQLALADAGRRSAAPRLRARLGTRRTRDRRRRRRAAAVIEPPPVRRRGRGTRRLQRRQGDPGPAGIWRARGPP